MKRLTIYTTDDEYSHFMKLVKSLYYVMKIKTERDSSKTAILNNIKRGLEEVRLLKNGGLQTTSAKEFLDQL